MDIRLDCFKDRKGNVIKKDLAVAGSMHLLYDNFLGRLFLSFLTSKTMANIQRKFLDSSLSTLFIDPFIKKNGISLKDYIPEKYISFNDFFTREIRDDRRRILYGDDILVSPSDGRVTAYKINHHSRFKIKNSVYSVASLLRDGSLAEYYKDGYFVLVRLSVDDYHHYIYSVSGNKKTDRYIDGFLHSVNPVVYDYVKVYKENSRSYSIITTADEKHIVQMEVGAMGVGRICNDEMNKAYVKQGDKKGHFAFGGSSIVLLLPKDSFVPDEDILKNTLEGYETRVLMGERIGSDFK
ncbi:MAG: phosphatidylserine decarboxylase [Lachnospiraceae bacterium]